jgi:hypothetical protein
MNWREENDPARIELGCSARPHELISALGAARAMLQCRVLQHQAIAIRNVQGWGGTTVRTVRTMLRILIGSLMVARARRSITKTLTVGWALPFCNNIFYIKNERLVKYTPVGKTLVALPAYKVRI